MKIERCVLCGPAPSSNSNIAHFNFPKDKFAEWKIFCEKAGKEVFQSSKLCCMHFEQKCYKSFNHRHILKKDAIPSMIPEYNENVVRKCNHEILYQQKPVKIAAKSVSHKSRNYCSLCKSCKSGVGYFHFPKDDNMRKMWIEFCKIPSTDIRTSSKLCQYHFKESDFHVTNCGRMLLKNGTIPSILNCNTNKKNKRRKPSNVADEIVYDVERTNPPKRLKIGQEKRSDEASSFRTLMLHIRDNIYCNTDDCGIATTDESYAVLMSCEDDGTSFTLSNSGILSSSETSMFTKCSFCNSVSSNVIPFTFPNNTAMRSVLMAKFGLSLQFLDTNHLVCISHFNDDDIEVNEGKKLLKERGFPWRYFDQLVAMSCNSTPELPTVDRISQLPLAISVEPPISTETFVKRGTSTPARPVKKKKSYVGDLTPSDFQTPRSLRRNLTFVKNKFDDIKVKVKSLQAHNRFINRRLQNVSDTLPT